MILPTRLMKFERQVMVESMGTSSLFQLRIIARRLLGSGPHPGRVATEWLAFRHHGNHPHKTVIYCLLFLLCLLILFLAHLALTVKRVTIAVRQPFQGGPSNTDLGLTRESTNNVKLKVDWIRFLLEKRLIAGAIHAYLKVRLIGCNEGVARVSWGR